MPDLSFGPFVIDVTEGVLRRNGTPVPLTPKAFDLLSAMVEQPGRLLSKDQLLERVWPGACVEESNIAYTVFALRKALGDTAENARYIETVPKRGYRFLPTVTASAANDHRAVDAPAYQGTIPPAAEDPRDTSVSAPTPAAEEPRRNPGLTRQRGIFAAAGLLLTAMYFLAASWPAPYLSDALQVRPLTSIAGVVRAPSLSPDGEYVVFTWDGSGHDNLDLYVQQVGAGEPMRLTTDPASDISASWSPDGRTIAFLRRPAGSPLSEVWLVAPLGGSERRLGSIRPALPAYRAPSLSWCPDSRCVLVTDAAENGRADAVVVIEVSGGQKRQLTFPEEGVDADPVISPNGRWLVFRRDSTPFSGSFHRVAVNGAMETEGELVRISSTLTAGKVAWLSDSRTILFAARGWLWKLDALKGSLPSRLPFVGQDAVAPVVVAGASGSQRLVYVRSFADSNVWRVDTASAGAPAPLPPVRAVASTRSDQIAALSPDERRLVFTSDRSGETEFWLSGLDGSKPLQLTSMAILPGFPRWSPNGEVIAFHGDPAGRPDVLTVPAAGGPPMTLTADMPNAGFPSFSRDGRWIYFTVVESGQPRIWKIPASGGPAIQVTPNAGALAIEAPDGKDLYYLEAPERPSSVWRLPLPGGDPIKILDGVISGNFDVVANGIYYIDRPAGRQEGAGDARLRFFHFSSGTSTTVAANLGRVGFGLSASRDGRMIFYSRVDASSDELMLVDDLR